jgi:hypothetical protein
MMKRNRKAKIIALFFLVAPIFILVMGGIVFYLWNWLAPSLFGLKAITFWQAFGLLVLCRMLFGGFGMGGGRHRSDWGHRMRQRMQHMSPEQREAFFRSTFGVDDIPRPAAPGA